MITCLNKALVYTQKNENNMLFMKARGYKWSDLKYGLSRKLEYQGNIMLQVPVIQGDLKSAKVNDALIGLPTRSYVLFVFNRSGKVSTVDYVEQIPSTEYRKFHEGELYYENFQGVQDEYNEHGEYLGYYNANRTMTRFDTDDNDTIPSDTSCINGGELPGAEIVAPYPPDPDDPFKDLTGSDSTATDQCPICGSELESDNDGETTYCPNCGYHSNFNGGGGGGNSSTSGTSQSFQTSKAVAYIKSKAKPYYDRATCGYCARAVREALERGGIDTSGHPLYAKDYGPYLLSWGFEEVSKNNYTPHVGDIRVFQNIPGSDAGHIDIYGGDTWYSDFKEKDFPGERYRKASYKIYRHK